ncbi:6-hydroxy-D-nicotine oxidase [Coniochaeta hoffmannii]|uniref:6-hydroxy-D-nicotine oxidase n=1 Tax=Coniochaeta hoffmannii TaxID=91930 RepID=A0AA38RMB0_9PEZI|nr:6-hydroxy-D-nicotine oxidase [Coniochaeta hoffmannii]
MPTSNPDESNCTQGGFPVYAVKVSSVTHVQLAVNFARNNNIRLVIKNTGHCYLGKSSGAGALSIWMHNLKDITYYVYLGIPSYSGPAMKIGAGVTVREVYEAAHRNNLSALGGICESVGYVGGYIAGGGHIPLSGLYDMAADHVMALEVVTAGGHFITVSADDNPDVYWALRGGSSGSIGVVTSIIIRVHSKGPRHHFSLLIRYLRDRAYACVLHGLGLYLRKRRRPQERRHIHVSGNRLLSRRNWEDEIKFDATFAVLRNQSEHERRRMGYHQAPRNRAAADNAVQSAFREVICFLVSGGALADPENLTPEQVKAASEEVRREIIAPFREVAPEGEGGGAYSNEANVDEPMRREAFYGYGGWE